MRTLRSALLLTFLTLLALRAAAGAPAPKPELVVQNGHSFEITALAFSPDDRLIATGCEDGGVKIWDVASGRLLWNLQPRVSPDTGSNAVMALSFGGDGKTLISCTHGGNLQRWETSTGRLLGDLPVKVVGRYDSPFAVTPDGKTIFVVNEGVEAFDLSSGKKLATLDDSKIGAGSLAISRDGRTLAAGGDGGKVRAWELPSGRLKARGASVSGNAAVVDVNADGSVVGVGTNTGEVWKPAGRTSTPLAMDSTSSGLRVAVSPDGKRMVIGGEKNGVFDTATGKRLAALHADYPVSIMTFSNDGRLLAVGDPLGLVQLYTLDPVRAGMALQGHTQARSGVAFTQRGQRMVTTGQDRTAKVWDCVAGRPTTVIQLPWDGVVTHRHTTMAASPDGRLIATGGWDGEVAVWDAESGKKQWTSTIGGRRYRQEVTSMAFSRDSRRLAVGNLSGNVGLWDATTGKLQLAHENGPDVAILSLAFSPDGRTLASGRADGVLDQWEVGHFKMAHVIAREVYAPNPRYKAVWAVAFTPDGRRLAGATAWGNVYLWETESEKEPEIVGDRARVETTTHTTRSSTSVTYGAAAHRAPLVSAAFSPDASSLATGSMDGTLTIFDLRTKAVRAQGRETSLCLNDLAFTPDGRVIATASADGTIGLWDAATARRLGTAVELDRGRDWVVTTPEGLFDGSAGGQRLMEWRIGDKVFALDQFFNEFYTPGLLGRILGARKGAGTAPQAALAPQRSLSTFPAPPRVEIVSPVSGDRMSTESVTVKVKAVDQGGGVSTPRLYLNGHRLPDATMQPGTDGTVSWPIRLTGGVNRVRATAFNKEGTVESRGDEIRLTCDATSSTHPTLHVVAIGIDRYQAGLSLSFARADAQAISGFFKPGLFGEVKVHLLTDDQASKAAIVGALREVGQQAAPQDAVLLYLAGHGTLIGDLFYYLPYDAKVSSEDDIRKSGLSSVEIGEALTNIPATKQLLVLDACHSGASATPMGKMLANRDSIAEIRAVQRLSRSSGSFLIAASKAEQYAKEIPELGHGVLTYAILTALGEKSKPAAVPNGEGQVTVNALLHYLDEEVPKLTERYQRGDRQEIVQASTGQDFPLVIVITR